MTYMQLREYLMSLNGEEPAPGYFRLGVGGYAVICYSADCQHILTSDTIKCASYQETYETLENLLKPLKDQLQSELCEVDGLVQI